MVFNTRMKSISSLIPHVTEPALGKKGMLYAKLIAQWTGVIGPDKARLATPIRISFDKDQTDKGKYTGGTLVLATTSAHATVIQHDAALWLDKINLFFGYPALAHIKLIHSAGDLRDQEKRIRRDREPRLSSETRNHIQSLVETVDDEDLKKALQKLGESLYGETNKR